MSLAACGGGSDSAGETAAATTIGGFRVLRVIDVHETEYQLRPRTIRIERIAYYGIRAVNDGEEPHALTIEGQGLRESTGTIEPGESKTIAVFLEHAGTYRIYCPVDGHEQKGMRATIRVH